MLHIFKINPAIAQQRQNSLHKTYDATSISQAQSGMQNMLHSNGTEVNRIMSTIKKVMKPMTDLINDYCTCY